jgi:hypothetical protein
VSFARILGGGPDGRYTIELDYGEDQKAALLNALSTLLARLDSAIATQLVLISEADAKEAAQVARVEAAQAAIISAAASLPPGSQRPDTTEFKFELGQLTQMQKRHAPLRLKLDALKFDRAQTLRRVAAWTNVNLIETRSAWCADFTEDAAVGSYVATADIPGESNLIVLAPGCRPWAAGDGILTAREILSPAQAFFNAAILPGWQKFKPTYRWGTCTAIDEEADTMSVSLASQPSSAQSLGINQASTLTGVPVVYMSCNAGAFEVGDRVVVQFIGQNWESPRVVGFLDTPKPCGFACIYVTSPNIYFESNQTALFSQIMSRGVTVEARINGADWVAGEEFTTADPLAQYWGWPYVDDLDTLFGSVSRHVLSASQSGTLASFPFLPDVISASAGATRTIVGLDVVSTDNVVEFRIRTATRTVFNVAIKGPDDFRLKTRAGINLFPGSEAVGILDYTLTG